MPYEKVSKPGAVGEDMQGSLAGRYDHMTVSKDFNGKPRNAIKDYPCHPENAIPTSEWTQNKLQEQRIIKKQNK